jgi:hypothetical protein
MKIRWNLNEEQIKKKEEIKVLTENKLTYNLKNFNYQEKFNKDKNYTNANLPLYERTKRTHEKLQENLNLFGTKIQNQTEVNDEYPLRLLNKNENLNESKKMILIEKDYEDYIKKNNKDFDYQQIQDKLNLNLKDEEFSKSNISNII